LLVVANSQGDVLAAARTGTDNRYPVVAIRHDPANGEVLHEVPMPDEVAAQGLRVLTNYRISAGGEPVLTRR
jgi:hypothetical protein